MDLKRMAENLARLTGEEVFIHSVENDQAISEGTSGTKIVTSLPVDINGNSLIPWKMYKAITADGTVISAEMTPGGFFYEKDDDYYVVAEHQAEDLTNITPM